jgi:cytosine/adenosine deaminase-related metal-dependent hydrolase
MTLDPAYASFVDREIGSLEVGKKADFAVLDRDIMQIPVNEVLDTKVKATVVDGRVLFGALERRQVQWTDLWWTASKYMRSRLAFSSRMGL